MARIARIIGGFTLIAAGLLMLALPGPGIVTIVGGLALLSKDLHWAGRMADWVKTRFGKEEDTPLPGSAGTPPNASLGGETKDS